MERAVRFVVGFLCHPDVLDDVKVELAEEVLRFLTARSMALNKAVRCGSEPASSQSSVTTVVTTYP